MLTPARNTDRNNTLFPCLSVMRANMAVNLNCASSPLVSDVRSNSTSKLGNNRKDVRKVTVNPIVIIQPKSITGLISLTTSEVNAIMVVNAVYKHGQTILLTISATSSLWDFSG